MTLELDRSPPQHPDTVSPDDKPSPPSNEGAAAPVSRGQVDSGHVIRLALAGAVGLVFVIVAGPVSAAPPPGATAKCRDGTYSFSQHRSGTCSHHGGVAVWLTGSSSSGTATGTQPPSGTTINVGTTVLLTPRTRSSGCELGANPDRRCSPGAYYSKLTKAVICSSGFHTSTIRNVPDSEKHQVEIEYSLAPEGYGSTLEIDHIVSLELGGSNDIANLYPEKATLPGGAPGYHVKDKLENRLHDMVCDGEIGLRSAQRQIASNWQTLYDKVFGAEP